MMPIVDVGDIRPLALRVVNEPVDPLIGVPATPSLIVTIPVAFATEMGLSTKEPLTHRSREKPFPEEFACRDQF